MIELIKEIINISIYSTYGMGDDKTHKILSQMVEVWGALSN
jgi:hypothetical protein